MLLKKYKNGNVTVQLFDDGTKIMESDDPVFDYRFASSMDICISEKCDNECSFCYANCTPEGKTASFDWAFLDTIHEGVEIAINLQFPLPDGFEAFLKKMKSKGVFVNATINQLHFEKHKDYIAELIEKKLIWGLGISLVKPTESFVEAVKPFKNAVIHIINGIAEPEDLRILWGNDLKLLILGFKHKGRGVEYQEIMNQKIMEKQKMMQNILPWIIVGFKAVAFDNLALAQMKMKERLSEKAWNDLFLGNEASSSFYINLVNGTYSPSSLDMMELPIGTLSAEEMFRNVKGKSELINADLKI